MRILDVCVAAALAACLPAQGPAGPEGADPDTDRDGLSDFHEVHKYRTDPGRADSDADGVPDGDPAERREFTYSVRAVMDVMAPFDPASMSDDYQDARVLQQDGDLLRFEVVVYPLCTAGDAIGADAGWRRHAARMKRWTRPGVTTNWNAAMRKQLTAELEAKGLDVAAANDRDLVREAARHLMERSSMEDSFTVFGVEFEGRRARVHQTIRPAVEDELRRRGRTLEAQWDRELFGAGMFATRIHGQCTSSAIYLATGLKALGIPARTIVCVPVVDANDEREMAMAEHAITHHGVRHAIATALRDCRGGWTSHTFNEVWVDGRWRRLNYYRLGQGVLDSQYLGLMVHVHTFDDHAEAGLSGWGLRKQHRRHGELFGGENPYSCVELDDRFGAHARVDNPEVVAGPPEVLTITKLYWYGDPDKDPVVAMRLDDPDTAGHLVAHVAARVEHDDCGVFYGEAAKDFVLQADGQPDVPVHATRGFWCNPDAGLCDFYLRIEPEPFRRMQRGVPYRLAARPAGGGRRFAVADSVGIAR